MKNYEEAQEYINEISARGNVLGLLSMKGLMRDLDMPKFPIIHIAGTNGKGSTGAFIESILMDNGYRVGRYVSPVISSYLERFTINSVPMSEADFVKYLSLVKAVADKLEPHPTVFEVETAVALLYLADCDYILLEVGLGGREDATNVIEKSLRSVITSISYDHSAVLGDTLEKIAYEKAGIIKENGTVVIAPQKEEVMNVIRLECEKKNAELIICNEPSNIRFFEDRTVFDLDGDKDIEINMLGAFQPQNAALAVSVCKSIGVFNIKNGLKKASWAGRFEVLSKNPLIICDGAHNEDAAKKLAKSITEYFPDREIYFIMGVLADKDYERIAELTAHLAKRIYTITPKNPRALSNISLCKTLKKYNKNVRARAIETALKKCIKHRGAVTIAFGSLSFLGEFKEIVGRLNGESKQDI